MQSLKLVVRWLTTDVDPKAFTYPRLHSLRKVISPPILTEYRVSLEEGQSLRSVVEDSTIWVVVTACVLVGEEVIGPVEGEDVGAEDGLGEPLVGEGVVPAL